MNHASRSKSRTQQMMYSRVGSKTASDSKMQNIPVSWHLRVPDREYAFAPELQNAVLSNSKKLKSTKLTSHKDCNAKKPNNSQELFGHETQTKSIQKIVLARLINFG